MNDFCQKTYTKWLIKKGFCLTAVFFGKILKGLRFGIKIRADRQCHKFSSFFFLAKVYFFFLNHKITFRLFAGDDQWVSRLHSIFVFLSIFIEANKLSDNVKGFKSLLLIRRIFFVEFSIKIVTETHLLN